MQPFHYAFKVKDIQSTKQFYVDILTCTEGRSTENWIDFDFFGHQLSAHISDSIPNLDYCDKVDGVSVPIPHFGCVLSMAAFSLLEQRLVENKIDFIVSPQTRYKGRPEEQKTMFFLDPSNNPIEIKAFKNSNEMFSK